MPAFRHAFWASHVLDSADGWRYHSADLTCPVELHLVLPLVQNSGNERSNKLYFPSTGVAEVGIVYGSVFYTLCMFRQHRTASMPYVAHVFSVGVPPGLLHPKNFCHTHDKLSGFGILVRSLAHALYLLFPIPSLVKLSLEKHSDPSANSKLQVAAGVLFQFS